MDGLRWYCVPLDVAAEIYASRYATLSDDERGRSARFRFERERRRFVVARGALREQLGRLLGVDPSEIRFSYNEFGKPSLGPEFGCRLRFSLSHSEDLALIAMALDRDVGVDLESIRPEFDYREIARSCFPEEQLDPESFFSSWTRREAYVKARGEGLSDGPLEVRGDWEFFTVWPEPGYIATVALGSRASGTLVTMWPVHTRG